MTTIAYHASTEQYAPSELLGFVASAEEAGFGAIHVSDHFHPWSARTPHAAFAWSWLGAAMSATRLPFSIVTCPWGRYHPAVIAQAVATLLELFGDRLTFVVGSGELLNEGITGRPWPDHRERTRRTLKSVGIMRGLWAGESVSVSGPVDVREAQLFEVPDSAPPIWCAALSEKTAREAGAWADGLLVSSRPRSELESMVAAFRNNGGAGKPVALKVDIALGDTEYAALESAREAWGALRLGRLAAENVRTPAEYDELARFVRAEDMRGAVRFGDAAYHAAELAADATLGFDRIIVHCVTGPQERFIELFSDVIEKVGELP